MKKGQATLFIVIGIVVLVMAALLVYMSAGRTKAAETMQQEWSANVNQVRAYISLCLDQTLLGSINAVGLNDSRISNYINLNLSKCINFTAFEPQGVTVSAGKISAKTMLAPDAIFVEIDYPVVIKKAGQTSSLDKFSSQLSLITRQNLPVDGEGIVQTDISISNGQSTLTIPKGTKALDKEGKPLTKISMRILGADYPIIGFFRYEFQPDGATFSPEAVLTTNYKDSDLPPGFHEQELEVKYFDKALNKWVSLPSNIDVVKDRLVTPISHFSEFGPSGPEVDRQNQVFIVSDKDWKTVLQLVPLTVWTAGNEVHKQPLLIFHEENNSFDADSLIHFMQQYNTEKVTLVGETPQGFDNLLVAANELGAGLNQSQLQRIDPETIILYWSSYDTLVYVKNDYKLAMMASVYASFINAPLVIQGGILDKPENFNGKQVVLVGDVMCPGNSTCNESYTLETLQQKYIQLTHSNKIIIVNPNDMSSGLTDSYKTELGGVISHGFRSLSMSAPLLAASKKEVIFFQEEVTSGLFSGSVKNINNALIQNALKIRKSIIGKILKFFGSENPPEFITIIASPDYIPDSVNIMTDLSESDGLRMNTDIAYANKCEFPYNGNKGLCDINLHFQLKTGRIYGISNSDVSSYIMRSVFYDDLFANTYPDRKYTGVVFSTHFWPSDDSQAEPLEIYYSGVISAILKNAKNNGYSFDCFNPMTREPRQYIINAGCNYINYNSEQFMKKQFITYFGHGDPMGWTGIGGGMDYLNYKILPKLDLSFGYTWVCLTNSYFQAVTGAFLKGASQPAFSATKAFGPNFLRKGGMAYFGMTEESTGSIDTCPVCHQASPNKVLFYLSQSKTLGEIFNTLLINDYPQPRTGLGQGLFLGDPTLILNIPKGNASWLEPPVPIFAENKDKKWWEFWK